MSERSQNDMSMARNEAISAIPACPSCGASARVPIFRFCSQCGAQLTTEESSLPSLRPPAPAKYQHVSMRRIALSCPECGDAMSFSFRTVCRRCGAELVMIPRLLDWNHVRVYVKGPRAALTALVVEGIHLAILFAVLALIVKACVPTK
jgi:predicted amidophosphoribosyltransferase